MLLLCTTAGRQEAASLAHELSPLMDGHAAALHQLGLHKVWASLHKLALAGGTAPSRAASQAAQPAAALEPVAAATAEGAQQQQVAPADDVVALQQRAAAYKAKCRELKASAGRPLGDGWLQCKRCSHHWRKELAALLPGSPLYSSPLVPNPTALLPVQATVVAMEGAAARWRSQAGEVEQGLQLLRYRLADLLAVSGCCAGTESFMR